MLLDAMVHTWKQFHFDSTSRKVSKQQVRPYKTFSYARGDVGLGHSYI